MHQNISSIILRRIAYGEADLVVTFFSRKFGRQSGFAKSARKSIKRFGGALEPGTLVNLSLADKKFKMPVIEEAQILRPVTGLIKNLDRIGAMSFGLELALAFLKEGQPQEEKFDLLDSWLENISVGNPTLSDKIVFGLTWLKFSGFAPQIAACAACGFGGGGRRWFFDFDHGGLICSFCAEKTRGARIAISSFAAAGFNKLSIDEIDEGKKVCEEIYGVLTRYISHIVGRPLNFW